MTRRWAWLLALVVVVGGPALWFGSRAEDTRVAGDRLEIQTADARHAFIVELALTPDQRSRGLMFRESLAADAGMLFIFEAARPVSFWMKNTLIPLDMLFIAPDGRIATIAAMTTPHSEQPVPSGVPVLGVLEVAGGTAAHLGIAVGDRVVHPSFAGAP